MAQVTKTQTDEVLQVIRAAESLVDHWASPISEMPSLADIEAHMTATAKLISALANALAALDAAEEQTHD